MALRGTMIVLGVLFVFASIVPGLVIGGLGGPVVKVAAIIVSLLLNLGLFFFAFRFMTSDEIPTKCLLIGVVVAAVVWELLQIVGGYYIGHVYKKTSSTYAQFALYPPGGDAVFYPDGRAPGCRMRFTFPAPVFQE